MTIFSEHLGAIVDVELTGNRRHTGMLVDSGLDIIVIYTGIDYLYLPLTHILYVKNYESNDLQISNPNYSSMVEDEKISYRKILMNAKGLFVELNVGGTRSIHGYITNILTNYLVFFSPVYKTMFIPLFHLKWLIPYPPNRTPYLLDRQSLPLNPSTITAYRTFEEQIKKMVGKIVLFNLGHNEYSSGLQDKVDNHIVELIVANGTRIYHNIQHIRSVSSPDL